MAPILAPLLAVYYPSSVPEHPAALLVDAGEIVQASRAAYVVQKRGAASQNNERLGKRKAEGAWICGFPPARGGMILGLILG